MNSINKLQKLAENSGEDFQVAQIRDKKPSPGGTTWYFI